jgi:glycosyltransferase involved in cell wall biosynthesis
MIARFQAIKGHCYFLKAAAKILQEFPEAKFLVVGAKVNPGGHEEKIPEEIMNLIDELDLKGSVICTGFRNDVPAVLKSLDVLVLPSIRESFGLILIEAMAAGTPVVSTVSEGPQDIIEDGISGFLVPVMDFKAIADSVSLILKDREKARQLAANAQKRAAEFFNLDLQAKKVENVFDELISQKR